MPWSCLAEVHRLVTGMNKICIIKMDFKHYPDQSNRLMLHSRGHVKALAEHLFQHDPVGLQKTKAEFGENEIIQRISTGEAARLHGIIFPSDFNIVQRHQFHVR